VRPCLKRSSIKIKLFQALKFLWSGVRVFVVVVLNRKVFHLVSVSMGLRVNGHSSGCHFSFPVALFSHIWKKCDCMMLEEEFITLQKLHQASKGKLCGIIDCFYQPS
jgi:hypothetical protein